MSVKPPTIFIRQLGLLPYNQALQAMTEFTLNRDASTIDEIWFLEHPPVFTLGQASEAQHLLRKSEIPIVQSDRGGQVTYHGPGQLMVYCLLNLKRLQLEISPFVRLLEQVIIDLLASFGIKAHLVDQAPGVYIETKKIASIGLRVKKGSCYHGFSLNYAMDLGPFNDINPCGIKALGMTQWTDWNPAPTLQQLIELITKNLVKALKFETYQWLDGSSTCQR